MDHLNHEIYINIYTISIHKIRLQMYEEKSFVEFCDLKFSAHSGKKLIYVSLCFLNMDT